MYSHTLALNSDTQRDEMRALRISMAENVDALCFGVEQTAEHIRGDIVQRCLLHEDVHDLGRGASGGGHG